MKKFIEHMENYFFMPLNEGLNPFTHIKNYLESDVFLKNPTHEMRKKGITVHIVDNANIAKSRINKNFEPTHTFDIYGTHYIVGKELGHEGTKIYRENGNRTYTNVDGFRILHEHPELTDTYIGRKIYNENKESFKKMPITASTQKLQEIMKLDPSGKIGHVSISTIQWLAAKHYNSNKKVIDSALESSHNIHPLTIKRLLTVHGIDRDKLLK